MYIAIKETVVDRIMKRLREIRSMNREAEFVAVTPEEFDALRNDLRAHYDCLYDDGMRFVDSKEALAQAHTYKVRDFEMNPAYRGRQHDYTSPFRRVPQRGAFMGVPLFIVPLEYMPA